MVPKPLPIPPAACGLPAWPGKREKSPGIQQMRQSDAVLLSIRRRICRPTEGHFFKCPGSVMMKNFNETVLSREKASAWMRIICSCCNRANIRSSTPFLLQRLMRVYMLCQLPKLLGSPLHLHPCSRTCSIAFNIVRLSIVTLPL